MVLVFGIFVLDLIEVVCNMFVDDFGVKWLSVWICFVILFSVVYSLVYCVMNILCSDWKCGLVMF